LGCARPAAAPPQGLALGDVPAESFNACAEKKRGDACVVYSHDVEALGACVPATQFSSDRRLFCDGEDKSAQR
jgi:hypothetical protein